MKYIFFILFTTFFIYGTSKNSGLVARLSPSSCFSCIINLDSIVNVLKRNDAQFVFPEKLDTDHKKLIAKYSLSAVIESDSLYQLMNPSFNSAIYICNNQIVARCTIEFNENLHKKLQELKHFPCLDFNTPTKLKVGGAFSSQVKFRALNNSIIIQDVANKFIIQKTNNEVYKYDYKVENFDSIFIQTLSKQEQKIQEEGDSLIDHYNIPNKGNFGSFQYANDTLYILGSIQSYSKPKSAVEIYRKLALFKAYKGSFVSFELIDEVRNKFRKEVLKEIDGFYYVKNTLILRSSPAKFKKGTKLLKVYTKNEENNYSYRSNLSFSLPEEFLINYHDDVIISGSDCNNGLFYFYSSNKLYDARRHISYSMPFTINEIDFSEVFSTGIFKQTHVCANANAHFIQSLLLEDDKLLLYTVFKSGQFESCSVQLPIDNNRNNLYYLDNIGLHVFNSYSQTLSLYKFNNNQQPLNKTRRK